MRIYILGGSGMIGTAFVEHFRKAHTVFAPTSHVVDIRDFVVLNESIHQFQPDVVINLAALCDMEACEAQPAKALQIHALGSANAALAADGVGATYVYLSSACVFDGQQTFYYPISLVSPISTYGKTKAMGESVARSVKKHIVLRTEWCFGGGPEHDEKFIGKIYRQILRGEKTIYAVTDKFGSLSYLPDLAVALEKILENGWFGTFHACCEGAANRYEIAQEFVRLLGADVRVEGVDSSYFEHFAIYTAPRPENEVLTNSLIPGFVPRHWKDALAEYAKQFKGE